MYKFPEKILKSLNLKKSEGLKTLLILDIDSCLVSVSPRTYRIFKEFIQSNTFKELHEKYEDFYKAVNAWDDFQESFYPNEFLKKNTSYSMEESLYEVFIKFWRERFFSNEFLKYDFPYPGAVDFAVSVYKDNIPIIYLTGRPREFMEEGTFEELQTLGFPDPDVDNLVELIMKPSIEMNDIDFKFTSLKKLNSEIDYGVFIDNEHVNLKFCLEKDSKIEGYIFDSVHSGRKLEVEFPKITSW